MVHVFEQYSIIFAKKVRLVSALDTDDQRAEIHKLQVQLVHLGTRHNILLRALTEGSPSLPLEIEQRDQAMSKCELENLIGPSCDHYDARKFAVEVILYPYRPQDLTQTVHYLKGVCKEPLASPADNDSNYARVSTKVETELQKCRVDYAKLRAAYETTVADVETIASKIHTLTSLGNGSLQDSPSIQLQPIEEDSESSAKNDSKQDPDGKLQQLPADKKYITQLEKIVEGYDTREDGRDELENRLSLEFDILREDMKNLEKSHHELETDLQSRESELRHLRSTLLARDGEDSNLKNQIQALRQKLSSMREERVLKSRFNELQSAYDEQFGQLEQLQRAYKDKDAEWKTTTSTLQLTESRCAELTDELSVASSHGKAMENQILQLQLELARLQAGGLTPPVQSNIAWTPTPTRRPVTVQSQTGYNFPYSLPGVIPNSSPFGMSIGAVDVNKAYNSPTIWENPQEFRSPPSKSSQHKAGSTSLQDLQPSHSSAIPVSPSQNELTAIPLGGLKKALRHAPVAHHLATRRKYALTFLPSAVNSPSRTRSSPSRVSLKSKNSRYSQDMSDEDKEEEQDDAAAVETSANKGKEKAASDSNGITGATGAKSNRRTNTIPSNVKKSRPANDPPQPSHDSDGSDDPDDDDDDQSDEPSDDGGNGGDNDNDHDNDNDNDDDDDDQESNKRVIATKWKLKHLAKPFDVKNNLNNMTRDLYQKSLNIEDNHDVLRTQFPSTPDARLTAYLNGMDAAKPMLVNTTLHWRGLTIQQMRKSHWNNALQEILSEEAERIFLAHKDGRFGKSRVNFRALFQARFNKLYRLIENFRFLPNETPVQRADQITESSERQRVSTKSSGLRRWKLDTRLKIATIMVQFCQDGGDESGITFWSYVIDALLVLGDGGMSDEESGDEDVVIDGVSTKQDVKRVKILWFRHESFAPIFQQVDETPKVELKIFTQQGRLSVKRIRSNDVVDKRDPPKGLPQDIFRPEYLDELFPHQKKQFRILTKKRFPIPAMD
ncbi:uncharacterized protein C8R40DRAFT_1174732 [Lentinula edodes]|uniref:uncharacterized protein n=1 Tax=Lentinula edodes TaxID=5353 RepID=UPI001E8DD923|nr:uncharacterized protein C8R40DRAFT_1174732 [Lentinula edodes]KAH7871310.1 hypothetical protein C8R40DRAFT_1174732 [Lentinula edodes]